jgi:CRISPR type IV-associated protein Csf2
MHSYIFEGVVTALSSISHIGETRGVNAKLRRERIVQPDGTVEEIPVISGNALRGLLRDRGMLHMLRALGYGVNEETGEVQGIPLPAFYFLFSGGTLTRESGRGLDIDEARRWRQIVPLVGVFGGAMGNQILPGRLKVDKLLPVCTETAHLLPERITASGSIWDYCQMEAYTRKDDEKDDRLRPLLAGAGRTVTSPQATVIPDHTPARLTEEEREDVVLETGQKQQMRYYVETLAAGTRFFWSLILDDVSPLEFEAFCTTLLEFSRYPYIGGKSSIGHGKVAISFDKWIELNPRLAPDGNEIGFGLGDLYQRHLHEHGEEIRRLIHALS